MPDAPTPAPDPLRVVVIGPGAVGSFLGGTLAAGGHDVALLGRSGSGAAEPQALLVEDPDGTRHTVSVRRIREPGTLPAPDLVIAAVKLFDLEEAVRTAAAWPGVPLLTVQNGVGAEELAARHRAGPLLAGSLTSAVEPIPGGVRRRRTGGIGIAVVEDPGSAAGTLVTTLAGAWTAAGLPARVYPDWAAMKWSKLLANLVGNATSALLDLSPGEIYADRRGYAIERRQLREALAVMRAMHLSPVAIPGADVSMLLRGIGLPEAIGRPLVARGIAGARGGKSPSLRLHVRGGGTGPTEARWLNGAVATAGARTGVPAPVNARLATLTDEVASDPARAAWFAGRPDRLAEALAGA